MGSEWPLVKLGDYCCKIGSGATPKGGSSVYLDSGDVCLIRSQNIYNEGFDEGGLVYIDEIAATKLRNVVVEHNDILLNITGDSVARVCLVPDAYLPARVNQHVAIIRPNVKHFDARFLRYFLASPKTQILLLNLSSAGATRNALTKSMIENFEVSKPSLDVQAFIANILQSLDNKIISNRQINQTLEQMAQTLFKSWFVDFDPAIDNALDAGFFEQDLAFSEELLRRVEVRKAVRESDNFKPLPEDIRQLFPDAFEECAEPALGVGGWMPKEWITTSLENVTSLIIDHRGKTPNKLGGEWSKKGYPAISAKNIKNGRLIRPDTIRYVDSKLYAKWMKDPLCAGDILMTSEAPVGELLYLVKDCEYLLSQRLYGIRANKEIISGSYLYFWLQTNIARADIDGRATGTTVVGIRQSELKQLKVMVPINAVVDVFSNLTDSYLKKAQSNEKQILELESLRDTLLPKLISGELSLSDVKIDNPEETLI